MRTIKLDFCGFWSNFDKKQNLFCDILSEKYNVEISDKPDFVIASVLSEPYEYLKYDCVRILVTGEPLAPDFNVFDYAIGFDKMMCLDANGENRYYRYPLCLYNYGRVKETTRGLSYDEAKRILDEKEYFCNFLYGHRSAKGEREALLDTIQKYKRVESAGSFLNNMPDHQVIPYSEKKMEFLRKCKFTIACESVSFPGFITEKIVNPFYSYSIPIYYGNPLAHEEFHSKAIINCHEFNSFDDVLDYVKEVDNNDELYIEKLMHHKFITETYLDEMYLGLKEFLWRIFSFSGEEAYRRQRYYIAKQHETQLNEYRMFHKSPVYRLKKLLLKP